MEGQCYFIGQFLTSFSQTQKEVIALLGHKFYYAQNRGWQSFALGTRLCIICFIVLVTPQVTPLMCFHQWKLLNSDIIMLEALITDCYLQISYEESHFFLQQEKRLIQRVYHLNYYALNFSESIVIPDFIEILCKQLVTLPRDYPSCISVCRK